MRPISSTVHGLSVPDPGSPQSRITPVNTGHSVTTQVWEAVCHFNSGATALVTLPAYHFPTSSPLPWLQWGMGNSCSSKFSGSFLYLAPFSRDQSPGSGE